MSEDEGGYWLGIDQGTTSTRAVLYDSIGQTVATAKRKVALRRGPTPGHVEQNPNEIAASVDDTVKEIIQSTDSQKILGAALATQRSSVVAWDRENGHSLSPVLSWQDTRCRKVIDGMQTQSSEFRKRTGLPLSAHYGATKIAWLMHADHATRAAIMDAKRNERLTVGPLASFVIHHLLDHCHQRGQRGALVDHANAGRTQLMDVTTGKWDPWLAKQFSVPLSVLPHILPIESEYGVLRLAPAPLLVVQGDQTAAVFGQGGLDDDVAHVNLGTGGFVLSSTSHGDSDTRLLRSVAFSRRSEHGDVAMDYVLEGTINGCGAAVLWAADHLGLEVNPINIERWLSADQPTLFVNTVGGLGSPFWRGGPAPHWIDEYGEPKPPREADVAMLAVLESILFLTIANLRAMQSSDTERRIRRLRVTGGLSQSDTFCQRLADATQLPVRRPPSVEATARGAAWLAAGRPANWNLADASADEWLPRDNTEMMQRCVRLLQRIAAIPTNSPAP